MYGAKDVVVIDEVAIPEHPAAHKVAAGVIVTAGNGLTIALTKKVPLHPPGLV